MQTITHNVNNTYIINKSKFICFLYKVDNIGEINTILAKLKNQYNDATHICYAYILPNQEKCYDDKEPKKTAGLPILDILKKKSLTNILSVVIRYFGGIKLGSNGLIRAYTTATKEALDKVEIKEMKMGYLIEINDDYKKEKLINNILTDMEIQKKDFKDKLYYEVKVDKDIILKLDNSHINYKIIKEIYL